MVFPRRVECLQLLEVVILSQKSCSRDRNPWRAGAWRVRSLKWHEGGRLIFSPQKLGSQTFANSKTLRMNWRKCSCFTLIYLCTKVYWEHSKKEAPVIYGCCKPICLNRQLGTFYRCFLSAEPLAPNTSLWLEMASSLNCRATTYLD